MKKYSVAQIVESAYRWANGDMMRFTYVQEADQASTSGDTLLGFLLSETSLEEGMDCAPDSPEHFAEAVRRMEMVIKECTSVKVELERHVPGRRWYSITGRVNGDDEDSLHITKAWTKTEAMESFRDYLRKERERPDLDFSDEVRDDPRRSIYVNHVVDWAGSRPCEV